MTVSCHGVAYFHSVRKMLTFDKREVLGSGEKWLVSHCYDCSQWRTQEFCSGGGGSTNLVEDRGHRERGSGAVAH